MDFNYSNESIKPLNGVLIVDSTGALVIPSGNTAQRPESPPTGALRFNSENKQTEIYNGTTWVSSNAQIFNRVVVQKNPGAGQYSSIAAACASITTNTASNPVEIVVYPGVYVEPVINIPDYVQIAGSDQYSVIVKPLTSTQNLFVMGSGTSINFLQIEDVGTNYIAVKIDNLSAGYALCHKVSTINCGTGWDINASTNETTVYLEYCDTTDGNYGVKISSSNNVGCIVNLENFYVYGEASNPAIGIDVTGTATHLDMQAFGLEGIDGTGIGLQVNNGALVNIKAGDIESWDTGVLIGDSGTGPSVNILATSIYDNVTHDLLSLNATTLGTFSGTASRALVDTTASPGFTLAFSDPTENSFIQTGKLFMGADSGKLTDVTDLTIDTPPLGLLSGGIVSISSGRTMAVTAGTGYCRNNDVVKFVEWNAGTITIDAGTLAYIYITHDGVISKSISRPDPLTNIILSRVFAGASSIITFGNASLDIRNYGNQVDTFLRDAIGVLYASGSVVTENSSTARAIDVTSGYWLFSTRETRPTGGTGITFLDIYKVSGVTTLVPATQVSNTTYLNGNDLASLSTGYYAKSTLYTNGEGAGERYLLQHADAQYATLQEAVDAPLPTPLIDPTGVPKIAAIITQQGNSNIVQIIDVRPRIGTTAAGTAGVSDHGELTGLADDDHTQYLLVTGTRAMTGNLDMGSNDLVNVDTINGVTITAHGSRHLPNGADPITTASAVSLSNSTTNTTGIANSLARSDHTHAITGFQAEDATLTALAAYNTNGLLTQTAADTFTGRSVAGTTNRITVTNGNGVAGNPTIDIASNYTGQNTITTVGTISSGSWQGNAITAAFGGTGQTSYAVGDLLYANTTSALARLPGVATGNALISGGLNTAPSWGKIGLTTHVNGTLAIANGGTNLTTLGTANQILGVNTGATGLEYKTMTAGTGISITPTAGALTVAATNNGTVTSVGLSLPSIFAVTGSPVTTSGTLTATLNTVPSNTVFAGSATSGQTIAPAFRTIGLAQDDINDVTVTSALTGQVLAYNGTRWINNWAEVIQVSGGAITATSSNAQIPYDATTPLSTEGVQLWTRDFTPKSSSSVIVILTHMFYTVNSAADVYVSGATFSGTTCVGASLLGFTTNSGNGYSAVQEAVITNTSTATRTISFRAGPNSNVTTFYGQGTGGQTYGGVQTGGYMIFEINNAN